HLLLQGDLLSGTLEDASARADLAEAVRDVHLRQPQPGIFGKSSIGLILGTVSAVGYSIAVTSRMPSISRPSTNSSTRSGGMTAMMRQRRSPCPISVSPGCQLGTAVLRVPGVVAVRITVTLAMPRRAPDRAGAQPRPANGEECVSASCTRCAAGGRVGCSV